MRAVPITFCCLALAAMSGRAAGPPADPTLAELITRCADGSLAVREQALLDLLARADADDLPQLVDALQTAPGTRSRTRVARVIGRIGTQACVEPLEHCLLHDESEHARASAAHALGDLRNRRAVEPLVGALATDDTARVRKSAATALGRIGGADATRALRAAARDDPAWDVRRAITWILDDRGPESIRPPRLRPGQVAEGVYRGTRYAVYVPNGYRHSRKHELLVVVHGTGGLPTSYLEMCTADADAQNVVALAPWFDWPTFPNFGYLNTGWDSVRADLRLLEIVDRVAQRLSVESDRMLLFGHSQGGAFVQRFVLAHPDRVSRACAGSPNSFASADPDLTFPYGCGPNPFWPDLDGLDYAPYLRTPLLAAVGAREEARFLKAARGIAEAARTYAGQHEIPCAIDVLEIPDTGHDGKATYAAARGFLWGQSLNGE